MNWRFRFPRRFNVRLRDSRHFMPFGDCIAEFADRYAPLHFGLCFLYRHGTAQLRCRFDGCRGSGHQRALGRLRYVALRPLLGLTLTTIASATTTATTTTTLALAVLTGDDRCRLTVGAGRHSLLLLGFGLALTLLRRMLSLTTWLTRFALTFRGACLVLLLVALLTRFTRLARFA